MNKTKTSTSCEFDLAQSAQSMPDWPTFRQLLDKWKETSQNGTQVFRLPCYCLLPSHEPKLTLFGRKASLTLALWVHWLKPDQGTGHITHLFASQRVRLLQLPRKAQLSQSQNNIVRTEFNTATWTTWEAFVLWSSVYHFTLWKQTNPAEKPSHNTNAQPIRLNRTLQALTGTVSLNCFVIVLFRAQHLLHSATQHKVQSVKCRVWQQMSMQKENKHCDALLELLQETGKRVDSYSSSRATCSYLSHDILRVTKAPAAYKWDALGSVRYIASRIVTVNCNSSGVPETKRLIDLVTEAGVLNLRTSRSKIPSGMSTNCRWATVLARCSRAAPGIELWCHHHCCFLHCPHPRPSQW